jgi:hypothetical protein
METEAQLAAVLPRRFRLIRRFGIASGRLGQSHLVTESSGQPQLAKTLRATQQFRVTRGDVRA